MKYPIYKIVLLLSTLFFWSCGAYFNQPISQQQARSGEISSETKKLYNLPLPIEPIVVGVYNFKDQTGQYKSVESGSTFSTAVTQGATTILIKALEDSKWFRPIERENLGNLLNERNIIRSTRDEYRNSTDSTIQRLNPLLFAGILLEGGVVSYDTNILTGGMGARYFGVGGSTKYRQDRITIYLRAVSTSSGEILKTVYVSKTILSQAIDVGLFRYVNFQRLLEIETGYTKNEPTQMAIKEAIEKAVEMLIIEGVEDNLWSTKEGEEKNNELVEEYTTEKELENSIGLYERKLLKTNFKNAVNASLGMAIIDGDYSTSVPDFKAAIGYQYSFIPSISLGFDIQVFNLNSSESTKNWWMSNNANLKYKILPYDKLSPYLYGGPGVLVLMDNSDSDILNRYDAFFKTKVGLGLEYVISERVSLNLNGDYNVAFTDEIDGVINGKRDDFYFNFGIGLNYHFGTLKKQNINF